MELFVGTMKDFDVVFGLFLDKARWAEENGIDHWTVEYVKRYFNREKLGKYVDDGNLYVLKDNGKIVAGAILSETDDDIWNGFDCVRDSIFLDILVSSQNGAGRYLVDRLVELFASRGYKHLKLNCRYNIENLKKFYRSCGFLEKGKIPHKRIKGKFSCLFDLELQGCSLT